MKLQTSHQSLLVSVLKLTISTVPNLSCLELKHKVISKVLMGHYRQMKVKNYSLQQQRRDNHLVIQLLLTDKYNIR